MVMLLGCFGSACVRAEVVQWKGDSAAICSMQDRLEELGYYKVSEDKAGYGSISKATLEALGVFCLANGLVPDERGVTAEAYALLMDGEPVARKDAVLPEEENDEHMLTLGGYRVRIWVVLVCALLGGAGILRCVWIMIGPEKTGAKRKRNPAAGGRGHGEAPRRKSRAQERKSAPPGNQPVVNEDLTTGSDDVN